MIPSLDELQAAFLKLSAPNTPPPAGGGAQALPAEGAPTPPPPSPVQVVDPNVKGYHLDVTVAPDQVVAAAQIADQHGFAIDTVTGVDWMAAGQMEVTLSIEGGSAESGAFSRRRRPRRRE